MLRDDPVVNLLTVLVLALPLLSGGPAKPTVTTVTVRPTAGRLWIVGSWTASGLPDSALTRRILVLPGGKADTAYHRLRGTVKRDSFDVALPLPGDTARGSFGVRSKWRNGRASAWGSRAWSYAAPTPAPVVDSVEVKPDSVALEVLPPGQLAGPENTQQFCGFVGFRGGAIAQRAVQRQGCDSIYRRTIPLAQRTLVTAAMQAVADSVCLTWTHDSDGNIVSELCAGGGLGRRIPSPSDTTVITLVPRGTLWRTRAPVAGT